jgi:uncharacterized protein (DUF1800 family)
MKQLSGFLVIGIVLGLHPGFAQTTTAPVMTDHAAARFLDQAAWGPTPAAVAQLQQMGIGNWLTAQFALNTSDLPDQPQIDSTTGKANHDLTPVQSAFFQNTVAGQDQLRQRVAFALSEIWVVSAVTTKDAYAFPPYWRLFRDNAFGNYRDIMTALTLSPAMGDYLNMANNNKGNPTTGTAPNENYARELMQLFTVGLTQLNPDGSPVLDSSGNPIPTYTQSIVTDNARALTGWTYPTATGAKAKANNPEYYIGQMFAVEAEHDETAKSIIGGVNIPAGQTAQKDLTSVFDALMNQPTMAPFVSRQLIQHLVTSDPSPAYVQRVSSVFTNNGSGVRGDMKAVITAILTDPEARAADEASATPNPTFGHMREPVLFLANILRGLNATLGPANAIYASANNLGQDLFYPETVFSYFSPLYTLESGQPAPEFQIYSTQTAADRADAVNTALYGAFDKTTTIDLTPFVQNASTVSALVDYIGYVFDRHSMSTDLQQAAVDAANAATGADAAATALAQARAALYVVLTSSEYQIVQ